MSADNGYFRTLTIDELITIIQDKDQRAEGLRTDMLREREKAIKLEYENKALTTSIMSLRHKFADYTVATSTAIDGLINILEAFEDVLQYEDGPREVVKFIKAFVARERRRLPKWIVKPEGYLAIDDEIPF